MTTINDDMSDIGRYPLSPILDTSTVDADELLDGKYVTIFFDFFLPGWVGDGQE